MREDTGSSMEVNPSGKWCQKSSRGEQGMAKFIQVPKKPELKANRLIRDLNDAAMA
jgi:hypothetical protein